LTAALPVECSRNLTQHDQNQDAKLQLPERFCRTGHGGVKEWQGTGRKSAASFMAMVRLVQQIEQSGAAPPASSQAGGEYKQCMLCSFAFLETLNRQKMHSLCRSVSIN
jgi:hypothetical protein